MSFVAQMHRIPREDDIIASRTEMRQTALPPSLGSLMPVQIFLGKINKFHPFQIGTIGRCSVIL